MVGHNQTWEASFHYSQTCLARNPC